MTFDWRVPRSESGRSELVDSITLPIGAYQRALKGLMNETIPLLEVKTANYCIYDDEEYTFGSSKDEKLERLTKTS